MFLFLLSSSFYLDLLFGSIGDLQCVRSIVQPAENEWCGFGDHFLACTRVWCKEEIHLFIGGLCGWWRFVPVVVCIVA